MTLSFKKPIILTRVDEDNKEFIQSFKSFYPKISMNESFKCFPLFKIVFEKNYEEILNNNCLIFTSRFGIKAVSRIEKIKEKSIFCVGKSTADVASQSGFQKVVYPEIGNSLNLIKLICEKLGNKRSSLHYVRGEEVSFDLKNELEQFGYRVSETIVYKQKKLKLSLSIRQLIQKGDMGGVVLFSANVAKVFCKDLKKTPEDFLFFCISDRVAQKVFEAKLKGNYKIRIASEPTTKEIMNLIYNEKIIRFF